VSEASRGASRRGLGDPELGPTPSLGAIARWQYWMSAQLDWDSELWSTPLREL